MPVRHVCLWMSNLPTGIPSEVLLAQLKDHPLLSQFEEMQVTVWPPPRGSNQQQWASVTGIRLSAFEYNLLQENHMLCKYKLVSRNMIWHTHNFNEIEKGRITSPRSPSRGRQLSSSMYGINNRKVMFVFNEQSLMAINLNVCDPNTTTLIIEVTKNQNLQRNKKKLTTQDWSRICYNAAGNVKGVQELGGGTVKVTFGCQLESMQCIRKLGGSEQLDGFQFIPMLGRRPSPRKLEVAGQVSTSNCKRGLGLNGNILSVKDEVNVTGGYVRFNKMDPQVLAKELTSDNLHYRSMIPVRCRLCQDPYQLLGVAPDLSFIAARCSCNYNKTERLDILVDRPVSWKGEMFSRLAFTGSESNRDFISCLSYLTLHHEPLLLEYDSAFEYIRITYQLWQFEKTEVETLLAKDALECSQNDGWTTNFVDLGQTLSSLDKLLDYAETGVTYYEDAFGKISEWMSEFDILHKAGEQNGTMFLASVVIPLTDCIKQRKILDPKAFAFKYVELEGTSSFKVKGKVAHFKLFENVIVLSIQFVWKKRFQVQKLNVSIKKLTPLPDHWQNARMKETMRKFIELDEKLVKIFLGWESPSPYTMPDSICFEPNLESSELREAAARTLELHSSLQASQQEAINLALHGSLTVIQGPPGTGKTLTAAVLAIRILLETPGKILIVSPSNMGCDAVAAAVCRLLKKLSELNGISVVRMYSIERQLFLLNQGVRDHSFPTLHGMVRQTEMWAQLLEKIEDPDSCRYLKPREEEAQIRIWERVAERKILRNANIIIATIETATDSRLGFLKKAGFSTLIVDEAAQALEATLLSLLDFNVSRRVFIGDHKQLNAVVFNEGCKLAGFDRSFHERAELLNNLKAITENRIIIPFYVLREQHRCHPHISHLLNKMFYGGVVTDADDVKKRDDPFYVTNMLEKLPKLKESRVVFIQHDKGAVERLDGTSYYNSLEVICVVELVCFLLNCGVPFKNMAIITPYEAQKRRVLVALKDINVELSVNNVDGIQGHEADIVIYSTVRVAGKDRYDFLANEHRLCVALSRAKYGLFVLGDKKVFASGSHALHVFSENVIKKHFEANVRNIGNGCH